MKGFIDAHVHIWTDNLSRYPLAPPHKPSGMNPKRFEAGDILREAGRCGVDRIILVQMSFYGFDNSYMLDAIDRAPDRFRGIAVVDENAPDVANTMRLLARKGVRGFRIVTADPSQSLSRRPGLETMFACCARENMAMAFLTNPEYLPEIERACDRYPHAPVIIDHMARIGMSGSIPDQDVKALCRLARYPKAMVKVSAFYALGAKRPPHQDLAPLIQRLYESFGPQRLMWASDCPFQVMSEKYRDSIGLITDGLPFLSNKDKDWVLCRTAEDFFFRS